MRARASTKQSLHGPMEISRNRRQTSREEAPGGTEESLLANPFHFRNCYGNWSIYVRVFERLAEASPFTPTQKRPHGHQRIKMKSLKGVFLLCGLALFLAPQSTYAMPRTSRTVCGQIVERTKELVVLKTRKKGDLRVILRRDTVLLRGETRSQIEEIQNGENACIRYKSPIFGTPFATRIQAATAAGHRL